MKELLEKRHGVRCVRVNRLQTLCIVQWMYTQGGVWDYMRVLLVLLMKALCIVTFVIPRVACVWDDLKDLLVLLLKA